MAIILNYFFMSIDKSLLEDQRFINLRADERWEIYHRLQGLQIDCKYSTDKNLEVNVHSPHQLLQVWSVLRQTSASRASLVSWLETCWQSNP
jgi:hypothetical protein